MRRPAILFATLALVLGACTTDSEPEAAPTAQPTSSPVAADRDAASYLVEVDGYAYADAPEAWQDAVDSIAEFSDAGVDSAVRVVRSGEQAVAIVWVTVVEEAKRLDDTPNEQLRAEAEAEALAEYEGRQEAEAEVQVYGEARIVHAQPTDESWKHVYVWWVKPSTIVRFMGDDAPAVETYVEAFVRAS